MKSKGYVALILAIFIGFFTAVSLCFQVLATGAVSSTDASLKIVVDAGHGGIDGGVTGVGTGIRESDLNLTISLKLCQRLQEKGFETAMTRKTKEGLYDTTAKGFKRRDMAKRKEIIWREDPDLLLSIHQNYYPSATQRGAQVFYRKGEENGKALATCLQTCLNVLYAEEGVKGRKNMTADYFIVSCAPCPSALIECGFLSSPKDEELLQDDVFLDKFIESVCQGVTDYLFSKA